MPNAEQVVGIYRSRRDSASERWRPEGLDILRLFEGELWRPISERPGEEEYAAAANKALVDLEQISKRAASTQPNVKFPSLKPGVDKYDKTARLRRLAALGFWDQNKINIADYKRYRSLRGIGFSPVQISLNARKNLPKWISRDPLTTYPSINDEGDGFVPADCVFAYKRRFDWLELNYPDGAVELRMRARQDNKDIAKDKLFEIIEYVDAAERIIVLSSSGVTGTGDYYATAQDVAVELDRIENRLGMTPVVAPSLISVGRLRSPYVDSLGMYIMRNKLASLGYYYALKTVFPESNFVEPGGGVQGEIIQMADPENGVMGHMRGGSIQTLQMPPNYGGSAMQDRIDREEMSSTSTPAEFAGQSASNIRTNARGQGISSAAVDPTLQELHEIMQVSKESELKIAIAMDKTYCNKAKSFYVGWQGEKASGVIDYKPSDIWETDQCSVFYPAAGQDASSQIIQNGQRVASQMMSRQTAMEQDPAIGDAEYESDMIIAEQLKQSMITELLQPGSLDVVAKARIADLVASNKMELAEAIAKVQQERQEAQASIDAQGQPTGVDPMAPEAQPGIAPEAAAGIQGPNQDQTNLSNLLSTLRRPQMVPQSVGA